MKAYCIKDLLTREGEPALVAGNATEAIQRYFRLHNISDRPIRPRIQNKLRSPYDTRFEGYAVDTMKPLSFNRDGYGFDKASQSEYFIGKMLTR